MEKLDLTNLVQQSHWAMCYEAHEPTQAPAPPSSFRTRPLFLCSTTLLNSGDVSRITDLLAIYLDFTQIRKTRLFIPNKAFNFCCYFLIKVFGVIFCNHTNGERRIRLGRVAQMESRSFRWNSSY